MSEAEKKEISATEWKVMKIVWQLQSCSAREVYDVAKERYGMALPTVKTLLRRLMSKGHLSVREVGNSYLYQSVSSQIDTMCEAADQLIEDTSKEVTASLVAHMLKKGKLSGNDIRELYQILESQEDKG